MQSVDGQAGELLDEKKHADLVTVQGDQQSRAHSAFYSPDGQYVFVQDLGLDKILAYTVNENAQELSFHGETQLEAGVALVIWRSTQAVLTHMSSTS